MVKSPVFALIFATALAPAAVYSQTPGYAARLDLQTQVSRLADPQTAQMLAADAGAVMAGLGLAWGQPTVADSPATDFIASPGAVVELVDIRLLLTQIAIQTGARDHAALVRAQGAREHDVILLRGGFASVSDLVTLAKGTPAQEFMRMEAGRIVLTRPLAIWADAGLTLGRADHLVLDRAAGSFIANLGRLDVAGGTVRGSLPENRAEPSFRPFVITAGQGSFTATQAVFKSLGMASGAVFGGLSIANNGLVPARRASLLRDSTLSGVGSVGLIGTLGAVVSGNRIQASGGTAILVRGGAETTIAANHVSSSGGAQAIRVTSGSVMVRISDNLLTGGARTGLRIDRASRNVSVTNNLVTGSIATGIAIDAATCVLLRGNLVASNAGAGINLSRTDAVEVRDNALLFNRSAGIVVRGQTKTASVRVAGNVFVGNTEGMRGATPGNLVLAGNSFDGQNPRVFTGDLSRLTADWLRGRDAVTLARTDMASKSATPPCALSEPG